MTDTLERLSAGQPIVFGGNRVTYVPSELAVRFRRGDHLVVVQDTGDLLHVPAEQHAIARHAVDRAMAGFSALADCSDEQITAFFEAFAARLDDDPSFAPIESANHADVDAAARAGRSTTRLVLSPRMRAEMIAGLRSWAAVDGGRDVVTGSVSHDGWMVEARRAPLGVVGFVFEGRPNVFADAAGVVRTGNSVVFRIGSDALGTARAMVEHALTPALSAAGLPDGAVVLVESAERSAGWALFSERRLALAVARGSGPAVTQLGAVARQSGVAVSLHGTGGAWLVAAASADADRFRAAVRNSLDRKVCNTLNVCCIVRSRAGDLVPQLVDAVEAAAAAGGTGARLHVDSSAVAHLPAAAFERMVKVRRADGEHEEPFATPLARDDLRTEWEWEVSPEVSVVVVDDVDEAVQLCNQYSPRFVASLISDDSTEHDRFYARVDAPFVGDGFTRWVDGQYALHVPELGLSNWQGGRLLARGAVLSGDSVHTVRHRARFSEPSIRR